MPEIAIEPRPGDSVGPYRITRTIGRGRMGVVFEGVADGGAPVAIKGVTTQLSSDDVFVRRLNDRTVAAGKLELATTITLLRGPAEGIDMLHASGLVHRDIKPANILVD